MKKQRGEEEPDHIYALRCFEGFGDDRDEI